MMRSDIYRNSCSVQSYSRSNTTVPHNYNPMMPGPSNSISQYNQGALPRRQRRARTTYSKYQLGVLEELFSTTQFPSVSERVTVANKINETVDKVLIWFKNRRAKLKREAEQGTGAVRTTKCSPKTNSCKKKIGDVSPLPTPNISPEISISMATSSVSTISQATCNMPSNLPTPTITPPGNQEVPLAVNFQSNGIVTPLSSNTSSTTSSPPSIPTEHYPSLINQPRNVYFRDFQSTNISSLNYQPQNPYGITYQQRPTNIPFVNYQLKNIPAINYQARNISATNYHINNTPRLLSSGHNSYIYQPGHSSAVNNPPDNRTFNHQPGNNSFVSDHQENDPSVSYQSDNSSRFYQTDHFSSTNYQTGNFPSVNHVPENPSECSSYNRYYYHTYYG